VCYYVIYIYRFLLTFKKNKNKLIYLETITSTTTINRISSSISSKKFYKCQSTNTDIKNKKLKETVEEKLGFNQYFDQYQNDNITKYVKDTYFFYSIFTKEQEKKSIK